MRIPRPDTAVSTPEVLPVRSGHLLGHGGSEPDAAGVHGVQLAVAADGQDPAARTLRTVVRTPAPAVDTAAEELTALRDAVLRYHDEVHRPIADSRSMRLVRRLHRLRLSWLAIPWAGLLAARIFLLGGRPAAQASEDQAVGLYRQHSRKDPLTARVEVGRLVLQLGPLDDPVDWVGRDRPGVPRVDRAELEAAADALIAYYLADRRTDDELLREALAVWAEYEELTEQVRERFAQRGVLRGHRETRDLDGEDLAVRERYLVAWRRWLDQQAGHGARGLGGR